MKKLILSILLLSIIFISCDGRGRRYKSNVEVLHESNLLKSFSTQTKFFPNESVEIITDTIFNNGFHVKLKYNALENDFISKTIQSNNDALIHNNYKNFEAIILVLKDEKIISKGIINKTLFQNHETPSFWKNAIMQYVWINYETSTDTHIILNTSFHIPETDIFKDFSISIDTFGNIEISKINLIESAI
ncbi:hypothetical protein [Thalassobellus suaedae]|uniref:Uncharacterized protein n=1 Tax=Thalassobellus suaedae TaxID=3074124 RepID=A0ABY9XXP2_9FLAO|nr:hypothetical protein RHP51_06960 [Flavobacteriaceae bacterium HL-DH14]